MHNDTKSKKETDILEILERKQLRVGCEHPRAGRVATACARGCSARQRGPPTPCTSERRIRSQHGTARHGDGGARSWPKRIGGKGVSLSLCQVCELCSVECV